MLEKQISQPVLHIRTDNESSSEKAKNLGSVSLILLSVLLAGSGQLIFKAALNDIGELTLSLQMFFDLATSPLLVFGLGVFGVSALFWLIALMKAELSFAYPFLSLSYIIVLVGGALVFDEAITPARIFGFVMIIAGLMVVARGETTDSNIEDT